MSKDQYVLELTNIIFNTLVTAEGMFATLIIKLIQKNVYSFHFFSTKKPFIFHINKVELSIYNV